MFEIGQFFYNSKFIWDAAITILGFIASIIGLAAVLKASKTVDDWKNKEDYKLQKEREKECEIWVYGELKSRLDNISETLLKANTIYGGDNENKFSPHIYFKFIHSIYMVNVTIPKIMINKIHFFKSELNDVFFTDLLKLSVNCNKFFSEVYKMYIEHDLLDENAIKENEVLYSNRLDSVSKQLKEVKKMIINIENCIINKSFLKT